MKLIEISKAGDVQQIASQSDVLRSVVNATVALYERSGFVPPWIGYVAVKDNTAVGTCGFKSPLAAGRVEMAYFTFPGHEGQGIATAMARQLLQIAQQADANATVIAQTLPEENASTTILKKLGFHFVGPVDHPEDGQVWEWALPDRPQSGRDLTLGHCTFLWQILSLPTKKRRPVCTNLPFCVTP
jgi:ribosomal-protein-alanine N-acetyltransferase